jgi:hypothetical protein
MPGKSEAIRAGGAFVELFADKSKLIKGLKSAGESVEKWGSTIQKAGLGMMAGATAMGAPLAASIVTFARTGSELSDISARTGVSVESFQRLAYAAGQSGVSQGALEKSLTKLQKNLSAAASGSKQAAASFSKIGLDANELIEMAPEQQFAAIGDALANIRNPSLRTAAALEIFGRSGNVLLTMFERGSASMLELMDRFDQLGLVMSTSDAQAADLLGDHFEDVGRIAKRTSQIIGAALAPAAQTLTDELISVAVAANQWISENPGVVTSVVGITGAVGAAGAATIGLGYSMKFAGDAMQVLARQLPLLSAPVLVSGGIAGLGYMLVTQTEIGKGALQSLLTTFPGIATTAEQSFTHIVDAMRDLGDTAWTTWHGITDAVAAGDLALAGEVAMAGLNAVWQAGAREISDIWTVTTTALLQTWNTVSSAMSKVGEYATAFLTRLWIDAASAIMDAWDAAVRVIMWGQEHAASLFIDVGYGLGIFSGSKEDAKAALRDQYSQKNAERDRAQAERNAAFEQSRQAARENLEAGLQGIEQGRQKRAAELQASQDAAIIASENKKNAARAKLDELRAQAADEKKKALEKKDAGKEAGDNEAGDGTEAGAGLPTEAALSERDAGTTSGLVANLNRGAIASPIDRLVEALENNTAALEQQYQNSPGLMEDSVEEELAALQMPAFEDYLAPYAPSVASAETGGQDPVFAEIRDILIRLDQHVAETGTLTA